MNEQTEHFGTVLSFDRDKGWGWVMPDSGETDVFLHRNNMPNNRKFVNRGERIVYTLGLRAGRTLAQNIRLAPAPAPVEGVTQ